MWNDTRFTRRLGIRYPIDVNDDDLAIGGDQHRPRSLYLLNDYRGHSRWGELNRDEHHPRAYACRQASSVTALEGSGAAKYRNFAGLRTM